MITVTWKEATFGIVSAFLITIGSLWTVSRHQDAVEDRINQRVLSQTSQIMGMQANIGDLQTKIAILQMRLSKPLSSGPAITDVEKTSGQPAPPQNTVAPVK